MDKWTAVEDGLPKSQNVYWAVFQYPDGERFMGELSFFPEDQSWVYCYGSTPPDGRVTHWMPLPDLPEEE